MHFNAPELVMLKFVGFTEDSEYRQDCHVRKNDYDDLEGRFVCDILDASHTVVSNCKVACSIGQCEEKLGFATDAYEKEI